MTRVPDHKPKSHSDLGADRPEVQRTPREVGYKRLLINRQIAHKHGVAIVWSESLNAPREQLTEMALISHVLSR